MRRAEGITSIASRNDYTTPFRLYDARMGTWMTHDPIMNASVSPYEGLGSNPISLTDPWGLTPDDDGGTLSRGGPISTPTLSQGDTKSSGTPVADRTATNVGPVAPVPAMNSREQVLGSIRQTAQETMPIFQEARQQQRLKQQRDRSLAIVPKSDKLLATEPVVPVTSNYGDYIDSPAMVAGFEELDRLQAQENLRAEGHRQLGLAGAIPVAGAVASLADATEYYKEGDLVNAGISVAMVVPFIRIARMGVAYRAYRITGASRIFSNAARNAAKRAIVATEERAIVQVAVQTEKQAVEAVAINTTTALESASTSYKGSTVLGHALSKHTGRSEAWGRMTGAMKTWHEQGLKHFNDIIEAPGDFYRVTTPDGIEFLEKRLSDGRGMRLNLDGSFKGFLD